MSSSGRGIDPRVEANGRGRLRAFGVLALCASITACGNDSDGSTDASSGGVGGAVAAGGSLSSPGGGGASTVAGAAPIAGSPQNGGSTSVGGSTSTAGTAAGGSPSGGAAGATAGSSGAAGVGGGSAGASGGGGASSGNGGSGVASGGSGGSSGGSGGATGGSGGATSGTGGSAGAAGPGGGAVTCPSTPLKAGDTNQTVMVGGKSRSYVLHVPASYDGTKPVPLVVDFHPLGGSGPSERSGSPYPAQTDREGVIMAFPSGLSGPSGGAWNVGPCCVKDVDDVAFARALVAEVQKSACIDPKRVYAVGFSMGGGMSHYLACHAADVFAAVAPAAFDLAEENVGGCKPSRPITVVSFRGTSDPVVSYAGGYSSVVQGMPITFLGAQATFEKWASINQCTGQPTDSGNSCKTYSSCPGGVEVTLCTKQGGGHEAGNASVGWPILKKYVLP